MDNLRFFVASMFANIAGWLLPIRNDIFGLVLLFALNFLFGLLADMCNHRSWSFRKAFCFFRDAAIYFAMVTCIYMLGHLKGEDEAAAQCVSFMIYVAIYFYGTNILRNARIVTQYSGTLFRILDFLYYVFSLRIVERFDYLNGYLNSYEKDNRKYI